MSGNYLFSGRSSATTPVGTETVPILQGGAIKLATVDVLRVPPYLGVGDTVWALYLVDAAVLPGAVVAGTNLVVPTDFGVAMVSGGLFPAFPPTGTALTGTWRSQTGFPGATAQGSSMGGPFLRIT